MNLQELLEKLSQNQIAINWRIEENDWELINTTIFWNKFRWDVMSYKLEYFQKLRKKERNILKLQKQTYWEKLSEKDSAIIHSEINSVLLKIQFLRERFDIEAKKVEPDIYASERGNMDYYNLAFFWVTKKDIWKNNPITSCQYYEEKYSYSTLLDLILYAQSICPELKFEFGKFPNLIHRWGTILIPKKRFYTIRTIITIFFHETTHFFRSFNGEKNLWFKYWFSNYYQLEEGIAIYNEYLYGNKITNIWKFIPYYNACFEILLKDVTEDEKINSIFQILQCKWFNLEQSKKYYNRFHRYCSFWSSDFYLKDLVYNKWYKNVINLIHKNPENYNLIMAWDIWIKEIEQWLISSDNNYNSTLFFKKMVLKIKTLS